MFALVVLGAEAAAQPIAAALEKDYEASALLDGVPPDQVIAELAVLLQEELVAHGTFADQFTHRNTQGTRVIFLAHVDGWPLLRWVPRHPTPLAPEWGGFEV